MSHRQAIIRGKVRTAILTRVALAWMNRSTRLVLSAAAVVLFAALCVPASASAAPDPSNVRTEVVDTVNSHPVPEADPADLADAGAEVAAAAQESRTETSAARSVCYNVHLQNVGWQGARCNGAIAGTTGQNRHIEAIVIAVSSDVGSVCYQAHLQNTGWQNVRCNGAIAGTTGQNRQMEALAIDVSSGNVCYNVHLQNVGWQGARCNGVIAGTTGQNRQIEAIAIAV